MYLEIGRFCLRGVLHSVGDELVRTGGVFQVLLHHHAFPHAGVSHVKHVVPPSRQAA